MSTGKVLIAATLTVAVAAAMVEAKLRVST